MIKSTLVIAIMSFLFLTGCKLSDNKTEIKIHLSEADYIRSLALNRDDSVFISAYNFSVKNSDPEAAEFLTVFERKYSEICPECTLASLFSTFELRDKVSYDKSNKEVIEVLNNEVKLAMDETVTVLKKRIESFCKPVSRIDRLINKTVVSVSMLPERNTWLFTVNRKTDGEHLSKLLQTQTKCGFWETYELSELWDYLAQANRLLSDPSMPGYSQVASDTSEIDTQNALFSLLKPSVGENGEVMKGSVIGYSRINDIPTVNNYLTLPAVSNLLPNDLKFMWYKMPSGEDKELFMLIAIKVSSRDGLPSVDEHVIAGASANIKNYPPQLTIRMNAEGARMISRMTRENIGRYIVFELNNTVISNVLVNEELNGGEFEISGGFTADEISDMAVLLGSGIMPKVGIHVISILPKL